MRPLGTTKINQNNFDHMSYMKKKKEFDGMSHFEKKKKKDFFDQMSYSTKRHIR